MQDEKCLDCGPLAVNHKAKWFDALLNHIFVLATSPFRRLEKLLPKKIRFWLETNSFFENLLIKLGLINIEDQYPKGAISWRSTLFFDEAKKRGMNFSYLRNGKKFLNYFLMRLPSRQIAFEGLPRAEFLGNQHSDLIDDKYFVKKILAKNNLPHAAGGNFWWFQKNKAINFAEKLYPVVVKPRWGSMSQHISVNVRNVADLKAAIRKALQYNPAFIVEKYLLNMKVYRATAVDFENLACCERAPAHIIGDGKNTINKLVKIKNTDPRRSVSPKKDTTLYKIIIDETTDKLLAEKNYNLNSVPEMGEIVFLQSKVILDLGADLFEVTKMIHPENLELFKKIARIFGSCLLGIDFLAEDISKSWRGQNCAVIELN